MIYVQLRIVSYHKTSLERYLKTLFFESTFLNLVARAARLPKKTKLFTVIRSPFVNTMSKEQFKLETHIATVNIKGHAHTCIALCRALTGATCNSVSFKLVLRER